MIKLTSYRGEPVFLKPDVVLVITQLPAEICSDGQHLSERTRINATCGEFLVRESATDVAEMIAAK